MKNKCFFPLVVSYLLFDSSRQRPSQRFISCVRLLGEEVGRAGRWHVDLVAVTRLHFQRCWLGRKPGLFLSQGDIRDHTLILGQGCAHGCGGHAAHTTNTHTCLSRTFGLAALNRYHSKVLILEPDGDLEPHSLILKVSACKRGLHIICNLLVLHVDIKCLFEQLMLKKQLTNN